MLDQGWPSSLIVRAIFQSFEIFRELHLNTYLKGMQKMDLKNLQKLYLLKT